MMTVEPASFWSSMMSSSSRRFTGSKPLVGSSRISSAESFEPAEIDHDIQDLFLFVQAPFLRKVPEPDAVAGLEGLPADVRGPGSGLVDAQKCTQGGRFARAVAAKEPEGFPGPDIEGQVPDDLRVPEVHPEVFDVCQRLSSRTPSSHAKTLTGPPSLGTDPRQKHPRRQHSLLSDSQSVTIGT